MENTDIVFTPPNYRMARVCRNCIYYQANAHSLRGSYNGACKLPRVADPGADVRPTHGTTTCDAHIFYKRQYINRISHDYNVPLPDDREM